MDKEKFLAYFKKKSQSKDETDVIQITNALTSVTENVTSAELAFAEEDMQKTYGCPKKYQVEIPAKIKKKLACMQEILVLLQQLKGLLLNIRNILLPEPQLTPGRRSAMTLTGKENWKTQPVKLWYAKKG